MFKIGVSIISVDDSSNLSQNILSSSIALNYLELNVIIEKNSSDMLNFKIHCDNYKPVEFFSTIEWVLDNLEDKPYFIPKFFCDQNDLIFSDIICDNFRYYFFNIIDDPLLKEYYILKYA